MCRDKGEQDVDVIKPFVPHDKGEYDYARKHGWFSVAYFNDNKVSSCSQLNLLIAS